MRDFSFTKSASNRTQPRSFQATGFQIRQLSSKCMSQKYGSVLRVDATFNCGNFFITLTSFQHKIFVNKQSGTHPVIVGPSIIYKTKKFEVYQYLAGQLKNHCENFGSLTSFGTDGEINIAKSFVCELPDAINLRCKIHLCHNVERKLSTLSFDKDARQKILNTIFGKRICDTRTKALADASTVEEFDKMFGDLESHWLELESGQHPGELQFYKWFKKHLAMLMKDNFIASVHQNVGLGSPPELYTQNISECSNSIVKGNAGSKKEWSDVCTSLDDTTESQERQLQKAVYEMGDFLKHLI